MKTILNKEVCLQCSRRIPFDCGHFNVECFNDEWERGFVYCYSKQKDGYFYKKIDEAGTLDKCRCKLEHIVLVQEELV